MIFFLSFLYLLDPYQLALFIYLLKSLSVTLFEPGRQQVFFLEGLENQVFRVVSHMVSVPTLQLWCHCTEQPRTTGRHMGKTTPMQTSFMRPVFLPAHMVSVTSSFLPDTSSVFSWERAAQLLFALFSFFFLQSSPHSCPGLGQELPPFLTSIIFEQGLLFIKQSMWGGAAESTGEPWALMQATFKASHWTHGTAASERSPEPGVVVVQHARVAFPRLSPQATVCRPPGLMGDAADREAAAPSASPSYWIAGYPPLLSTAYYFVEFLRMHLFWS